MNEVASPSALRGRSAPDAGLGACLRQAIRLPERAGHLDYLDGWRGLCIGLVLIGHFIPGAGSIASAGVEFFFVLSGRLMAEILILGRQPIATFMMRRAARIIPALWVYVAAMTVFVNGALWSHGLPLKWTSPIAAGFFFHNYLPQHEVIKVFEHSWSLAVEEHGYLLLAAIAIVMARQRRAAAFVATVLAIAAIANGAWLWCHPPADVQSVFWRSDVRVASLLVSFALCLWLRPWLSAARGPWAAVIPPLATLAALIGLAAPDTPYRLPFFTVSAAMAVNTLEISPAAFRRWLAHPALVWAGTISFSLYLWQQLFSTLAGNGWPAVPCFALALICALWSFKQVENPARAYLTRRWPRALPRAPRHDDERPHTRIGIST